MYDIQSLVRITLKLSFQSHKVIAAFYSKEPNLIVSRQLCVADPYKT